MDASKPIDGSPSIQLQQVVPTVASTDRRQTTLTSRSRAIPEFADLVVACRHRPLRTVLVGGILSSTLVCIAWLWTQPLYEAESLVRVREQQDVVFSAQTSRANDASFFRTQEKLVLSPPVLAATLNHTAIGALALDSSEHDAIGWLRQLLHVETQAGSEVMSITASHPSPHIAQAISNAVTQSYLNEVTSRLTFDREERERKLEQAAGDADKRLDELWAELTSVARSVGSDSSQSLVIRDEIQLQAYRDYAKQLRAAQQRREELQRLLVEQRLSSDADLGNVDQVAESLIQQHPDLISARQRLAILELQIQQIRQVVARENSPRLLRLLEDRELHVSEVDRIVGELRNSTQEQLRQQGRNDRQASLTTVQQQIDANLTEINDLQSRLSEIDTSISRTNDKSGVQLDIYRHAVDRQTRLADSLWQSLQELKIEGQSQPRVTLIGLSQLPLQASHARQLKAIVAAGIVGWAVAILMIGYLEWRDCRVRCLDDVTSHSSYPVFGSERRSGASEAAARMMLRGHSDGSIPTLMVSSATESEPRHLVCMELAQAFCTFKRRTIVIDCDTSPSGLGKMLGAEQQLGILQCSASGTDLRRHVIPSNQEGIDVLPVGHGAGDQTWIDPQILNSVIHSLRRNYPVIIVNGPAVMFCAESLLLASQVDMVLFSVFPGASRWSQLAASEQAVIESGIRIGGSILHNGRPSAPWKLMPERRGTNTQPLQDNAAELGLNSQLIEIQNDLRQVQSDPSATGKQNRPHQESST